ncbi:MAG: MBOAT family protein [Clostridiales bacterium]|nr:MBOAT family protein [Clostridiales bacterium]
MLFTSYAFIGFVILLVALYYVLPKKAKWPLLLLGSYVFYFFAGWKFLFYIAGVTIITYIAGLLISSNKKKADARFSEMKALEKSGEGNPEEVGKEARKRFREEQKKKRRRIMAIGITLALLILAVVKYTNFTIYNINGILSAFHAPKRINFLTIALPMGISFYTFQAVGYVIDVYRDRHEAQKNFFKYALFVGFFPQLVQGPISRYGDLSKELFTPHTFQGRVLERGLQRVIWGYFKKLVIADRILPAVNTMIDTPENFKGAYVFLVMMFYALELYADFTGGIDITIGIAEMLGIPVKENFERPFFSKNIAEYWRRWHITMGTWFTDYIFYPISVSGPMLKLSKWSRTHLPKKMGKRLPVYLASFVVWFTTGIWHGASWNFIVWGLGNFVVIMISQELEPLYAKFHKKVNTDGSTAYKSFQIGRTILLMSALRLFDCYRDVPLTFKMFGTMFTTWNWNTLGNGTLLHLGINRADYVILALGTILMFVVSMIARSGSVRDKMEKKIPFAGRWAIFTVLLLVIVVFGAYGLGYDASQFIYNQF